jgi:hypothetical protein
MDNLNSWLGKEIGLDITGSVWVIYLWEISHWEYACDTEESYNVPACDYVTNVATTTET